MSVFSSLSKENKEMVFSGAEVPKEWLPSGSWDIGANYLCFVKSTRYGAGSFKFINGETKNTIKAIKA